MFEMSFTVQKGRAQPVYGKQFVKAGNLKPVIKQRTADPVKNPPNQNLAPRKQAVPTVKNTECRYQRMSDQELIDAAFKEFQNFYGQRVTKTTIKSIINGEIIKTNENNIFVNKPNKWSSRNKTVFYDESEQFVEFEDPKFDNKLKCVNKTLYDYQIDSIKKIRELELNGKYVCETTGETIRSNGWLLHLPIGAGKSLVFLFLALFYKTVPSHPIIVSTSGKHIPDNEMTQPKVYPFYYENPGYIEGKEGCVIEHYEYTQRPITVIITHDHLMDQLFNYLREDFHPKILEHSKIKFVNSMRDFDMNAGILIVPAKSEFINRLVQFSYEQPFMRVIIDDYTNMNNVDDYRQILASSTLFVSGSGFERDKNRIPPSYYTLRHMDVDKISMVAPVEMTQKGILRNSVATFNINSSETDFSSYQHIQGLEDYCSSKYNFPPGALYSAIENNGNKIKDYLGLTFLIHNMDRLGNAINNVEIDLKNGKLKEDRVKHYLKWKLEYMNTTVKELYKDSANGPVKTREIPNPFYKNLMARNTIATGSEPILHQNCQVCGNTYECCNNGWGFISNCCGSFFCYQCAKCMATKDIIDHTKNTKTTSEHCYCTICHKQNPTYFVNCVRSKANSNVQSYSLVDSFMDTTDLKNSAHFDYFFKMLIDGFTPKYTEGRAIEVTIDNSNNGEIIQLFPKDQLTINSIQLIDSVLKNLEIKPHTLNTTKPCVLFYGCPQYMEGKIRQYFKQFNTNKESNLYNVELEFKSGMNSLIGLHQNILAIIVWNEPANKDEIHQLIGRILRLNSWNNPLYFYITCKSSYNNVSKKKEMENKKDSTYLEDSDNDSDSESEEYIFEPKQQSNILNQPQIDIAAEEETQETAVEDIIETVLNSPLVGETVKNELNQTMLSLDPLPEISSDDVDLADF